MSIPNPGFPRPGVQYDFQNESQFRAAVQAVISALDAEIQGDTAILAEHDIVGANHTASGLTTGHVLQATGATTFGWQPLDFTDIGGTIADAQVPETAVTQHEAALTILETQITDGALLARVGGNETITGSWTFTDGTVTFDPGNAQSWIDINTDLANYCGIHFQHNNLTAFEVSVDNGTNNFYIYRWNPDGTRLGPEIAIAQATGKVTISNDLDITGFNVGLTGINSHTAPTATGSQLLVRDLNDNGYVKVITPPTANGTSYYLRFNSSASGFTWQPVDFLSSSVDETITGAWTFNGDTQFITTYATASGYNYPFYSQATQTVASTQGTVGGAFYGQATHTSGTVLAMLGLEAYVAAQGAGGTVTHAYGIYVWGGSENATSTITNWYGLYLETPDVTGTITNKYGLYANNYGTGGYPIYTNQGIVSIGDRLALRDNTQYPVYGVLYKDSGGTITGATAPGANGAVLVSLDGTSWTTANTTTGGGTKTLQHDNGGAITWGTPTASQADSLYKTQGGTSYEDGDYFLALANATGTLALTKLTLIPEGAVVVGTAGGNSTSALDASWIDAGTFPGSAYTFTTNLTVGGKLTVDNDIFLSNGLNGAIKYDGTLVEFVPTLDDSALATGWARGLEWNAGGASTNTGQVGTLGSGDSITYVYISADGTSGTSDYNSANTWRWLSGGAGIMYMGGTQPEVRFYESDAAADAKYWRLYAANGVFALASMTDALGGTNTIFTITRNGNTPDYMNWRVHDIRIEADGNDAQYHRWYANSNTGQTHLEFRRTSDSAMGWRITGQASTGDFYLSNYNFSTLQEHWIFGDASSGELTFDGQRITLTPQIRASATYDNGTIASGATLNVNWDNGNSQRCAANLGNITISVNQATAYQGTSYTMEVTNIHGSSGRTVSWSGVSQWVGSSPTATVDAGKMTVVQLYVARNRAGTNYIIGSVILDNVTVPT